MFSRILTSAVFAGAAAGLIAALLQLVFVQPVLLQAELFESGQITHFGAEAGSSAPAHAFSIDPLRDGLSVIFTMLIYSGYALVLLALMSMAEGMGKRIDAQTGLLWGLAGFIVAHLAPAFSLPPEVPGVAAADVAARQVWWFATVAASGVALWLFAFGRTALAWGGGAVLLLAPHVIGAPMPTGFSGPVPPEIAAHFASRALGVGAMSWALLGVFCGYFWARDAAQSSASTTPQSGSA